MPQSIGAKKMDKKFNEEDLNKSIDSLLDDLFTEDSTEDSTEDVIEKSKNAIDEIVGAPKQTDKDILEDPEDDADKAAAKAPKSKKDHRPVKEDSDVPEVDTDGNRAKGYDSVQAKASASDVANEKKTIAKSEDEVVISKEDFEILKKAKADAEEAEANKAKDEQEALIKAMVSEQTEDLKKALNDSTELMKSLAKENAELKSRPKMQKSFTSIQEFDSIEKAGPVNKSFTKSEMLDAAEELAKSGDIRIDQVIELENNGTIYEQEARQKIEKYLNKN